MSHKEKYCAISKELLLLLKWVVENGKVSLEKLVKSACLKGFSFNTNNHEQLLAQLDPHVLEEVVFNFFAILEGAMMKITNEELKKLNDIMVEDSDNLNAFISFNIHDGQKIIKALSSASNIIKQSPHMHARDVFYKEFLKCWSPHDGLIN